MLKWRAGLEEALAALAGHGADPAQYLLRHGSMRAGLYAPRDADPQEPHTQDELYLVLQGRGIFVKGSQRVSFQKGDLLFVEAGVSHRFEFFTKDFCTWVVFWGPAGGEGMQADEVSARDSAGGTAETQHS